MDDSHLSVVLDLSPAHWHQSDLSLSSFLSQLLVFLNAHIALKHENTLAVFAALPGKRHQPDFSRAATPSNENHVSDPRILILSVSPDLSTSYIPIMNSIFSAQKLKITIDACQIFGPDTVFLQQAAHLTGGAYLYLERRDALLQYLIMAFLPPPAIRKVLAVPTQDKIDFRAACFCHKNIVDIGFVCSVCLSIFCQPVPVCSTCRTKFPIKTLKRLNAARPPTVPSSTSTNSARPSPTSRPPPPADANRNGFSQQVTNGSKH
ncbi:transcription factor Tfb4-domain-containing protein [Flammula alnicola]|nr:transcription factor Tfb4-domain-containing protein [Flammula alnicola]